MSKVFGKYANPLNFVFESFKGHKKMFYIFFLGKVIEGVFYVVFPVLAKLEMDQLVEKNQQLFGVIQMTSFNIFLVLLTLIFAIKLFENFLKSFIELFQFDYVKIYDNFYTEALYGRLKNVDPWIFLNSRNQRFIGEILWNSSKVWDVLRTFLWDLISNIFVVIWVMTVLALINIWILLVLIIATVVQYFIEKIKEKYNERQNFEDKYEYEEKIWILSEQMRKNMPYLMTSGWFDLVLSYLRKNNKAIRERIFLLEKKNMILSILWFITENISEICIKLIVWYSIFFSTTSIGTMTMTLLYVTRMGELFHFLRVFKFRLDEFKDDLLKLDVFLDITKTEKNKISIPKWFDQISFEKVVFKYPNFAEYELKYLEIVENRIKSYTWESEYTKNELHMIQESKKEALEENPIIFKSIDIKFQKWNIYGLVWKNWAGKTTLISLLLNYFDDYEWKINFSNYEAKNIHRDFFIQNTSVINQIPYVIEGFSVRENIMLWVFEEIQDEKIFTLLEKFNLKKKILKNRQWLDAQIGYDNDFSGGEKQLLVLIRTILQNKKILIMDEWTNQLDADNEMIVMNELLKNKSDKIIIFITHRMTSIRKADKIYCLEEWKITSQWTHEELLKTGNIYKEFWEKQVEY